MTKNLNAIQLTVEAEELGPVVAVIFGAKAVVVDGSLRAMQRLVTSAEDLARGQRNLIEYAPCDLGRGIELVIDEEGLYHPPVIVNIPAMELWAEIGDRGCIDNGSVLVGNVLVVGATNGHGNPTDCPAWVFERFGLDLPEGTSTCDNCGRVEHTAAELAVCIESVLGPVRDDD